MGNRRRLDTVVVLTLNNADQGSVRVDSMALSAPCEKSEFSGSGGSMVASLKLEGIDGRAPQGVEPAAFFDSTRENLPESDIGRIDRLYALS